ncbi:hypothetical protein C1J03_13545 [Sulfitobacter sp. SK012]|uniref:hypothetical protein n=1 Tax=Sulfitobacter sp. SK012 TaxID=1389005 RepID=UPI000E0C0E48|nr:hypothetical protein [Sulfitobacter sp. SK012]AXI46953.1 hypothetical protein C1J03_13545 [Sulfitobacter sp. SK012]
MSTDKFTVKQIQWKIRDETRWNYCMDAAIKEGHQSPSAHARALYEQEVGLDTTEASSAGRKLALTEDQQDALNKIDELYKMFGTLPHRNHRAGYGHTTYFA